MEASKCPKCGDEPHFVEHMEKWYCYSCNSYIENEESHVEEAPKASASPEEHADAIAQELKALEDEDKPTCSNCGAELEEVKDGKLYCFICESYPEEAKPEPKAEQKLNEAQVLIETAAKPEVVEKEPESFQVAEPEPSKETPVEVKICSVCGQPLKWIGKYQRDYCYGCRKYAPKEGSVKPSVTVRQETVAPKDCPECGKKLKYIEKYKEFYCFDCKKYPLRTLKKNAEASPASQKIDILSCPKCGDPMKYIEKYQRHYCYSCKEYAPKGFGNTPGEKKVCPTCNQQMKFVSEYNEWYCYKCKKYSLRPNKPILLV